jgi:hypothetical protein
MDSLRVAIASLSGAMATEPSSAASPGAYPAPRIYVLQQITFLLCFEVIVMLRNE